MTTISLPSVPTAPRIGFDRIAKAVMAHMDHRRTQRALRHLDPHLLRDVGLTPPPQDPAGHLLRIVRLTC